MKSKNAKNIILCILMITMLTSIISILTIPIFASEDEGKNKFLGYSENLSQGALKEATNTSRNSDGTYTVPISTNAPQITFLIPGCGSQARTWSNNYQVGMEKKDFTLAYNSKSLVEKLRDYASADIYYAKITSVYPRETKNEGSVYGDEIPRVGELRFSLYEYPDICTKNGCDSCMFEDEQDIYNTESLKSVKTITDISNHIVILFDPADSTGSNNQIYEQLDYVVDKIVYDVKVLNGGILPKVNFIAHSRGAITSMQYALEHPFLVDSLITVGGALEGSTLGLFPEALNLVKMSADRSNENFTYGIEDILNPEVYNSYKNQWNDGYEEKYSHINFCAVGGAVTVDGLAYILANDTYYNEKFDTNLIGHIIRCTCLLTDIMTYNTSLQDATIVIPADIFINLNSQHAKGYSGVKTYTRVFETGNIDLEMLAEANMAIPHNLEPGDAIIHEYILNNINTGAVKSYVLNEDNAYTLHGRDISAVDGVLTIPDNINGISVSRIGAFAFDGDTSIHTVVIPSTVKRIEYRAFGNCTSLETVVFEGASTIETISNEAFAGCSNLTSCVLPYSIQNIGDFAFAGSKISSIYLGANLSYISPTAYLNSSLTQYSVNSSNDYYSVSNGVLYDKYQTKLISYPCKKADTTFTLPQYVESIEAYSFYCASALQSVNLGTLSSVPDSAFSGCSALATINAPNVEIVGKSAFAGTAYMSNESNTKSVGKVLLSYSGTDTSLILNDYYSIAPLAFDDCDNLTSITLGGEITNIGMLAFINCDNLTNVYLDTGTFVYAEDFAFNSATGTRNIYVANHLVDEYQNSDLWAAYSDSISTYNTIIHYNTNSGNTIADGSIGYYANIESLPTPTKTGYNFAGWTCTLDGETFNVNVGDVWTSFEEEATFVASWTPVEYSITLHTNGGSLTSAPSSYTIESSISLPTPIRVGYTFRGWYNSAEFSGSPITSIAIGNYGSKEYYAKWEANTYTITLNYGYNGATIGETRTVTYGESFALPVVTRDGYTFNGWFYNNIQYTNSNGNSMLNWNIAGNTTLSANWTLERYYVKVAVNSNGSQTYYWMTPSGLSGNRTPIQYGQAFDSADQINSAFNPDKISLKEGHKFRYFTDEAITAGKVPAPFTYWGGTMIDLGGNETEITISLNAYFEPEINFSIVFENYAASSGGTYINPIVARYSDAIAIWSPSKVGYTFQHWVVADVDANSIFEGTIFEPGTIFSYSYMPDLSIGREEDGVHIYLQAVFTPNIINVQYNSNGGTTVSNTSITYDVTSYSFPVPTKTGYSFGGWYDGVNGTGIQYSNASGALIRTWDKTSTATTLYAKWTPISYNIVYNLNSGTNNSGNPSTYNITSSTIILNAPTRNGYRFMGWYTTSAYTNRVTQITSGSTGNVTLYARWEKLYTVTFINQQNVSTSYQGISGEVIKSPWLHPGYIYAYGSTTVLSETNYTIVNNITLTAREKTFSECYSSASGAYIIYTKNQFSGIRTIATSSSAKVILKANIYWNETWTPIPVWRATLDGESHSIVGINIAVSGNSSGAYGFVAENYGTITAIGISDSTITISSSSNTSFVYVGAIAGINRSSGTISYCGVDDTELRTEKSASSLGGVVGHNEGLCLHVNIMSLDISGYGDMGMIAGSCSGSSGRIKGCFIYGDSITFSINGTNRSAGGIVGHLYDGGIVEYCCICVADFAFGSYTNIDKKELAPSFGYIVGHMENATMQYVCVERYSMDYGGLPSEFWEWFKTYNPRKNVCSFGNGTCGLASNSTIIGTDWNGKPSSIPT